MGCAVLEVDVNGEEVFFVDKEILASFCNRLKKLFNKPPITAAAPARPLKVVLHDLPGGAEAFELVARFCYTSGRGVEVTQANACVLRCAAQFMEMAGAEPSLISMAEKSLGEMPHWPWQSVVDALKQCQRLLPIADASGVLDRVMSSLLSQMTIAGDTTPTSSSPESSAFRFSCDTKSSISMKASSSSRAWWFEDLAGLSPDMMERVVRALVAKGIEHAIISRFLFYYLKCRIASSRAEEKRRMIEAAIGIIGALDRGSVSCKALFGILRISSPLKLSEHCHERLVSMIGSKIDHATLDNLLIPAPAATGSLYDVGLVLRFLRSFLDGGGDGGGGLDTPSRLKRVGTLMDLYLAEVAPDPFLQPSKFVELATALAPTARDCHDALYRAIDVYFQVHAGLTDEEKTLICKGITYEKLSSECCKHLAKNPNFPTRTAVQALASQHSMLKNLIRDTDQLKSRRPPAKGRQCDITDIDGDEEQVILYAKRLDLSLDNENLKALLEGMHWRVMELEKVCSRMKKQMTKIRAKKHNPRVARSLPRLCS